MSAEQHRERARVIREVAEDIRREFPRSGDAKMIINGVAGQVASVHRFVEDLADREERLARLAEQPARGAGGGG